jgi:hypothetical protein
MENMNMHLAECKERMMRAMQISGASPIQSRLAMDAMMPHLDKLIKLHRADARERGERDGLSRAGQRPGFGDMGG